jgi:hypothetical protein
LRNENNNISSAATALKMNGLIPVNGLCSVFAVSEIPDSEGVSALVEEALNGMAK